MGYNEWIYLVLGLIGAGWIVAGVWTLTITRAVEWGMFRLGCGLFFLLQVAVYLGFRSGLYGYPLRILLTLNVFAYGVFLAVRQNRRNAGDSQ